MALNFQELLYLRSVCTTDIKQGDFTMKGVLLWLIGIPIPIIILLYIFNVL